MTFPTWFFQAGENDDGIEIEDIAIRGRGNQEQQERKDAGDHEDDERVDEETRDKEGEPELFITNVWLVYDRAIIVVTQTKQSLPIVL